MDFIPVDPYNKSHVDFLYHLLDERPPYANISHRKMPTYEQHQAFMRLRPYVAWYIVLLEQRLGEERATYEKIGSVYFTHQNEIGIFLTRAWQGKGLGRKILAQAESMAPDKRILANIAPRNDRSMIMFERAGYRLIQHTYEKIVE